MTKSVVLVFVIAPVVGAPVVPEALFVWSVETVPAGVFVAPAHSETFAADEVTLKLKVIVMLVPLPEELAPTQISVWVFPCVFLIRAAASQVHPPPEIELTFRPLLFTTQAMRELPEAGAVIVTVMVVPLVAVPVAWCTGPVIAIYLFHRYSLLIDAPSDSGSPPNVV